jgi:hypothetical protein
MTLIYILLGALVVWLAYKKFVTKPSAPSQDQPNVVEIPIKIKVTDEGSALTPLPQQDGDKDEWEGSFWEVTQPFPTKARLRIKYTDGAGKRSERTVDVRQFGAIESGTLVIGHCHMRNGTRTFRTDRIESCIDEETGEVVSDVRGFLQRRYDESPDRTKDMLLESEYDTLRVLLYVGKADGQLRAAEKAVIRDTCIALSNDSRLTDRAIEELFMNMTVPTMQAFKLAVGRLSKRDSHSRTVVMTAAEQMVATQKAVHQAEQEALDYIRKRFFSEQNARP